jgi:hypothetical protein
MNKQDDARRMALPLFTLGMSQDGRLGVLQSCRKCSDLNQPDIDILIPELRLANKKTEHGKKRSIREQSTKPGLISNRNSLHKVLALQD